MIRILFFIVLAYILYKIIVFFIKTLWMKDRSQVYRQDIYNDYAFRNMKDITHRVKILNKNEKE